MSKQPARHAHIEIAPCIGSKRAAQPHFLRLVAANGETLAHSEAYSTRSNARRGVQSWVNAMTEVVLGQDADYVVREVTS